ncbi:hypothetical protein F5Y05DRAFT_386074 [Hypoxylon sp. FL0543]|nr:hypothetical protein F5Y05DRAFT_386074 [Hypoxylon sp. FL0543]
MATQDQSFSSNNPFRRKLGTPTVSTESPAATQASTFDGLSESIPRPPFTTFKTVQPEEKKHEEDEKGETVSVQQKPKKVIKRVRVQSPPPSSPEDAAPVARFPPVSDDEYDDDDGDTDSTDSQGYEDHVDQLKKASAAGRRKDGSEITQAKPPVNPFSRTLQDLEQIREREDTSALGAGTTTKSALDVDSFKRLLLTGYASIPSSSSASASGAGGNSRAPSRSQPPAPDGASNTDASSVSRQSIFDAILQDTPRTSHEVSEPEDPDERKGILPTSPLSPIPSASARKKPPPPNSRHGKLIKIELGADAQSRAAKELSSPISINTTSLPAITPARKSSSHSVTSSQSPPLSTDVNKPLPQPPYRPSVEEAVDSPFDREAIGKVPEPFVDIQTNPRPPTPPVTTRNRSESNGSTQPRKPAAPPPRRHGRSDSKAPSVHGAAPDDDTPPRSSIESNRSRADSVRANANSTNNTKLPAPPPPRRPNHARQGSSFTSPSQGTFASTPPPTALNAGEGERSPPGTGLISAGSSGQIESPAGLATITTTKDGLPKLSPPPPPPARSASTRRPPSVRSMDAGIGPSTGRKVSREKEGGAAPPPPPPPRQRGSSRASVETPAPITENARSTSGEVRNEPSTPVQPDTQSPNETKQGAEILADLDALQREVDALMGKYGKPGGS